MASSPPTQYDEVRYPGKFYPQASPVRLATLATLWGLRPAPIDECRVLEMGCGEGGNIVPLAYLFPRSRFLGVDLASSAIDRGNKLIQRLGLNNAELIAQNLLEFPRDAGTFDYIVAHGVLSWVPEPVRQEMLEICSRHLAPLGVAYISYNTLPGGYLRSYPRDLMRFHTRFLSDCERKTRAAREIVELVASAIPVPTIERELLKQELKPYEGNDSFLFHDLIAEINDPIYFLDFMDAAARCGLQFVSEAILQYSRTARFPEKVQQQLERIAENRLEREQYLDFIHGRRFRQTILCRAGHELDLKVTPERMERLLIVSAVKPPEPVADPRERSVVEFKIGQTTAVRCGDPLPKAAFLALGEAYPRALRFSALKQRACERIGLETSGLGESEESKLIQTLVSAFVNGAVEFHTHRFEWCTAVSQRPKTTGLARVQAEVQTSLVTMGLDPFPLPERGLLRDLILLLDGTRDFEALTLDLARTSGGGVSEENVRRALETLAANAMLVE